MLIGFTFKNYTSFFDENILTMKSNADTKFKELNTINTNYGELLKSAFIFGANGSGKSNFINAVNFMKEVVLAELSLQSRLISKVDNFAFSKSSDNTPSLFEIEFIADGVVYDYGFELLKGEVNREYLFKKTKRKTPVFERTSPDFNDISLSKDMDNVKDLKKNTRRDTLFLYWANGGNNELAMTVYRWFVNIQIFETDNTSQLLNATIDYLENSKDGKNSVLSLLQKADVNILDFELELLDDNEHSKFIKTALKKSFADTMSPLKSLSMKIMHNIYDEEWRNVGILATNIGFESAGTRKLFEIAGPIIKALENGNVVFIDEIDSRLHPMLVRYLVMMFNSISKNPKNAQLICNTHDVLLLDEDIRRDQIYFTEKDKYGVSRLYALTDFKGVRKDSKLLKQYLIGSFGATPRLQDYFLKKTDVF